MTPVDRVVAASRRHFLQESAAGLGLAWLATRGSAATPPRDAARPLASAAPHFAGKAKRVIFLHMAGAPSQLELFNYRPELAKRNGQDCPQEFVEGKRFAFIRGTPKLLGPVYPFHQEKKTGLWVSDRLPHLERQMDKLCFVHSMQTDQFNHAPAQLVVQTGNQALGHASLGAWVTYGLGTEDQNLPGFVVLLSGGHLPDAGKAAWGAGYLPSVYQGVQCRTAGEPVLYLNNPAGIDPFLRGKVVDTVGRMNGRTHAATGDPETVARIAQYELAYRMQTSSSDAFDLTRETQATLDEYGAAPGRESFANNCLLARRLVERGVRFVQLFDWGWDSHGASGDEALNRGFKAKCEAVDRPAAALLADLERTGLLKDTLVVWGSEFGRTPMRENRGGQEMALVGRDHHPAAFTVWLAGAGVKRGFSHGETDPFGYSPTGDAVPVRNLHATLLHLLGFDHKKLVFPFQGLDQKLTGVRPAGVVDAVLA